MKNNDGLGGRWDSVNARTGQENYENQINAIITYNQNSIYFAFNNKMKMESMDKTWSNQITQYFTRGYETQ